MHVPYVLSIPRRKFYRYSRWHTYVHSLYATTRSTRFVVSVPAENFISAQPHKSIYAEMNVQSSTFGMHPYIHQACIHGCTYYPQLSTFIYTYVKHVNIPVTTANTPLDRRLDGHALTAHTYRSVEVYRSMHYHSSEWHPYNFTPYGRRKKTNIAYYGVEVCDPFITT